MCRRAGRQADRMYLVIEEEVWVLQRHCLFRRWMQELNICMRTKPLTIVLYLRCEMQGQDLQCKYASNRALILSGARLSAHRSRAVCIQTHAHL